MMEYVTHSGKALDLIVVEDHDATAEPAADYVCDLINSADDKQVTICFSTGSTPLPLYRELVARYKAGRISFANVRAFLLDEYMDLPAGHPACFRTFLDKHLFRHVDLDPDNIHFFFGPKEDHMQVAFRYEKALAATGGIDLIILGIGINGHIAFNEPGTLPTSRTRMIKLDQSTRQANARFFSSIDEVPTHALSVGIGNILEAKRILMLASGPNKMDALKDAFTIAADVENPASYLQNFQGPLTLICDKDSAKGLKS